MRQISYYLQSLSGNVSRQATAFMHYLGINILDVVIVFIFFFYAYEGYMLGFITAGLDLISFLLSFVVALKFYGSLGPFLADALGLSPGFARAIGFFILALVSEIIFTIILRKLSKYIPDVAANKADTFNLFNHILGILPGLGSAFIILSFLLSVIISLPSSPILKNVVTTSRIGKDLVGHAGLFESKLNDIFGGALTETMNFLTVKPEGNETVDLRFAVEKPTTDFNAEQEMFRLVNKERIANGVPALTFNTKLQRLAQAYSKDMFQRGYFSHYNPEGQSPFDRMNINGITYGYAGENLALAPSTELAMQGLMNSPGHRKNILSGDFTKIGIGVMDGGIYGKMFTQEFTD